MVAVSGRWIERKCSGVDEWMDEWMNGKVGG